MHPDRGAAGTGDVRRALPGDLGARGPGRRSPDPVPGGRHRGHYVQGTPAPTAVDTGTTFITSSRVVFHGVNVRPGVRVRQAHRLHHDDARRHHHLLGRQPVHPDHHPLRSGLLGHRSTSGSTSPSPTSGARWTTWWPGSRPTWRPSTPPGPPTAAERRRRWPRSGPPPPATGSVPPAPPPTPAPATSGAGPAATAAPRRPRSRGRRRARRLVPGPRGGRPVPLVGRSRPGRGRRSTRPRHRSRRVDPTGTRVPGPVDTAAGRYGIVLACTAGDVRPGEESHDMVDEALEDATGSPWWASRWAGWAVGRPGSGQPAHDPPLGGGLRRRQPGVHRPRGRRRSRFGQVVAPPLMLQTWTMPTPTLDGIAERGGRRWRSRGRPPCRSSTGPATSARSPPTRSSRSSATSTSARSCRPRRSSSRSPRRSRPGWAGAGSSPGSPPTRSDSGEVVGRQTFRILKFDPSGAAA